MNPKEANEIQRKKEFTDSQVEESHTRRKSQTNSIFTQNYI